MPPPRGRRLRDMNVVTHEIAGAKGRPSGRVPCRALAVSSGLGGEPDRRRTDDAGRLHRLLQVGVDGEGLSGGDRRKLVRDGDVVGIVGAIDRPPARSPPASAGSARSRRRSSARLCDRRRCALQTWSPCFPPLSELPFESTESRLGSTRGRREFAESRPASVQECTALTGMTLRYFLAIGEAGTLAGAGRALGVQHSTVGRRLDAVEQALGVSLFTRTPDGLILTDAGSGDPAAGAGGRKGACRDRASGRRRRHADRGQRAAGDIGSLQRPDDPHPVGAEGTAPGADRRHPQRQPASRPDARRGRHRRPHVADAAARPDLARRSARPAGRSTPPRATSTAPGFRRRRPISPDTTSSISMKPWPASPGAEWLRKHGEGARVVLRGNSIVAVLNAAVAGMGIAALPCFVADAEPGLRRLTPRTYRQPRRVTRLHADRSAALRACAR